MGFLSDDKDATLSWAETAELSETLRGYAASYFVATYAASHDLRSTSLWGDEIEYMLVAIDHDIRTVSISTQGDELLQQLRDLNNPDTEWHPEYSRYMLEGIPRHPLPLNITALAQLEASMRHRRSLVNSLCPKNTYAVTIPSFWRLGADPLPPGTSTNVAQSQFVSDDYIHPHSRFPTLTRNIRERRGSCVKVQAPALNPQQPPVVADAMIFGMGMCCLQCTIQTPTLEDARYLYDQLAVIAPIALALSAGTVTLRGKLIDTDARWRMIEASVDDRYPQEHFLGISAADALLDDNDLPLREYPITRSRFGSISLYVSPTTANGTVQTNDVLNDIAPTLPLHVPTYRTLRTAGIDGLLARHIAYLMIRDPLIVYRSRVTYDPTSPEHFEAFHSTNWNSVRLKLPTASGTTQPGGWRVEFRVMEVQPDDTHNAYLVSFIVLLAAVLLDLRLDLRVPISQLDENMATAQRRNAVCNGATFHWRLNSHAPGESTPLSISQIMLGVGAQWPGLIPLIQDNWMRAIDGSGPQSNTYIQHVLAHMAARATGQLCTFATWQRRFVAEHPCYPDGNVDDVSELIQYDMLLSILCATARRSPGMQTLQRAQHQQPWTVMACCPTQPRR